MKKLTWTDKVIIGAILAFALTSPLVGQYIIQGIILAYDQVMLFNDEIAILAVGAIAVALVGSKVDKRKAYNAKLGKVKAKAKKSPAFLE